MTTLFIQEGLGNGTMDLFLVTCYNQIKNQLHILRYNLEHIADPLEDPTKIDDRVNTGRHESYKDINDESFRKLLRSRVIKCWDHYKLIIK